MNDEMLITKRACSSFLLGLSPAFSASSFSQPPYSMCVSVLGSNLSPCLGKLRKIVDKLHLRRPLPQSCLPFFPIFLTVFPWLTFYLFVPALAFAPHPPTEPLTHNYIQLPYVRSIQIHFDSIWHHLRLKKAFQMLFIALTANASSLANFVCPSVVWAWQIRLGTYMAVHCAEVKI